LKEGSGMGTLSPTIKVGCCGFPVARARYFRTFPIVEVQQTFYRPPRTDTLKRWRQEAPEEFAFSLKAWQLITHNPSSPTYRRLKMSLSNGQKAQAGDFRYTDLVRRAWDATLEAAAALRAFHPASRWTTCPRPPAARPASVWPPLRRPG
jgi:uncharacterized protein YecE (DUF72 family)